MIAFNIIQLAYVIGIFWRGSDFDTLFSKCNLIVFGVFLALDVTFASYLIGMQAGRDYNVQEIRQDDIMIDLLNLANNIYIHL